MFKVFYSKVSLHLKILFTHFKLLYMESLDFWALLVHYPKVSLICWPINCEKRENGLWWWAEIANKVSNWSQDSSWFLWYQLYLYQTLKLSKVKKSFILKWLNQLEFEPTVFVRTFARPSVLEVSCADQITEPFVRQFVGLRDLLCWRNLAFFWFVLHVCKLVREDFEKKLLKFIEIVNRFCTREANRIEA